MVYSIKLLLFLLFGMALLAIDIVFFITRAQTQQQVFVEELPEYIEVPELELIDSTGNPSAIKASRVPFGWSIIQD